MYTSVETDEKPIPPKQNVSCPSTVLYPLRIGTTLHLIGFTLIYLTFVLKNRNLAVYTYNTELQNVTRYTLHKITLLFGSFLRLIGVFYISFFQFMLSDSAAWSPELRSGAKSLSYAVILDMISCVIDVVLSIQYVILPDESFIISFNEGGAEYLFSIMARYLHLLALFFFGQAYYLLEFDKTVNNNFKLKLIHLISYGGSLLLEYLELQGMLTKGVSSIAQIITFTLTLLWVCEFESAVNTVSRNLNQPEFTNDIENQVNTFSRIKPNEII